MFIGLNSTKIRFIHFNRTLDLLITRPVDSPPVPLRAAGLGDQSLLRATLAEAMIVLEDWLAVGLMNPVAIGGKTNRGEPVLFTQLLLLDQAFPLANSIAVQRLIPGLVSHGFASRG
jgi:hypothetical protein